MMNRTPKLSKLYVDEDGFLMCGEPMRSTSMVEGLRLIPLNVDSPRNFEYDIVFINDLGWLCNGYHKRMCAPKYRLKNAT